MLTVAQGDAGKRWSFSEARVVSYKNQEARTLRIWVGNNPRPITQEVFSP